MKLKKELGLFSSVSMLAGIMIGSGIYFLSMLILGLAAGSLSLSLVAWVIGGIITLFSALTYAELGTMFPKTGGYYVYLKEAYGKRIAFLSGITNFFLSSSGSIALLALLFAQAIGFGLGAPFDPVTIAVIASITIIVLSVINYLGVQYGKIVQNIFFIAKLIPLFIVILYGLLFGSQVQDFSFDSLAIEETQLVISGLLFAVARTLFAYEGWTNLNTVVEEMKDAKKDLPKALLIASVLVMSVYLLFVFGLYRIVDFEFLQGAAQGAVANGFDVTAVFYAFGIIFSGLGDVLGYLVFGSIIISVFGALNGSILAFPRVYYAMAKDDMMPSVFKHIDAKRNTPSVAIFGQTIVSLIIVLLGYNNVDYLLSIILFGALVFNTLIFIAVFKFRKTRPEANRPYKVWGYPIVPGIAILGMVILLVFTAITKFIPSLIGLGVLVAGYFFYQYVMLKKVNTDK